MRHKNIIEYMSIKAGGPVPIIPQGYKLYTYSPI